MTHCDICHTIVPLTDQHRFDGATYCPGHCPACKPAVCAVDGCDLLAMTRGWCQKRSCRACHRMREAKRGHRRGTPRRWSLRGAGG